MMLVSVKSKFIKMTVDVLPQQDRELRLGSTTYVFELLTWRAKALIMITRLSLILIITLLAVLQL